MPQNNTHDTDNISKTSLNNKDAISDQQRAELDAKLRETTIDAED